MPTTFGVKMFVPGKLVNPLNGSHGHWRVGARYRKGWREKVKLLWLEMRLERVGITAPEVPKFIVLTAYVWNLFDSHDGLRAALKPCVDGLVDAGIIHSDADRAGHRFVYAQEIRRKRRGVQIAVEVER